jgi:hypothetical protein
VWKYRDPLVAEGKSIYISVIKRCCRNSKAFCIDICIVSIVRVPILTRTRNDAPRCIRVLFINRKTYDVRSLRFVYVDGSVRCYIPQHVENTRKQGKKLSSFVIHIKPPFFLTSKRSFTKIDPQLAYNLQSVVKNLRLLTGCTGIFGHVTVMWWAFRTKKIFTVKVWQSLIWFSMNITKYGKQELRTV